MIRSRRVAAAPVAFKEMLVGAGLTAQVVQEPVWRLAKGEELINRKIRPEHEGGDWRIC